MNRTLSTALIVIAIVALTGALFIAGAMYGRNFSLTPAQVLDNRGTYAYGPGMMGGRGNYGMMGNRGYGMMNGYAYNNANTAALTVEQAKAAAQKYLSAVNNPDLAIAEVMIFSNNAYVAVKEKSTGIGAFELLVDPVSQVAYPEHGPNMMWNLKYGGLNHQNMMGGYGNGMMRGYGGGMMGGWNWQSTTPAAVSSTMPVSAEQAVQAAQKYLDANLSGAAAANDPMQFYGYYTLDYSKDGKVVGMLSVNGYSGQVFPHTWHANFIDEAAN